MPTVSLCMIARNEQDVIKKSLESAVHEVDEIIVLDTGSTDATVEIARSVGATVFETSWQDDFSCARNESISYATGDYVVILDADEQLRPGARDAFCNFITESPHAFGRIRIRSSYRSNDGSQRVGITHATRFFPRVQGVHYVGRIHEQLVDAQQERQIRYLNVEVDHDGYNLSDYELKEKSHRNLRLLLAEKSVRGLDAYYSFQLGKTYESLSQQSHALQYYKRAYELGDSAAVYYPELTVAYLYALLDNGCQEQVWTVLRHSLELYPDFSDLYFFNGRALMAFNVPDFDAIRRAFEMCLMLGEQSPNYPSVEGVGSYLAAYNLGVFYEAIEHRSKATLMYKQAADMGFAPALSALTRISMSV